MTKHKQLQEDLKNNPNILLLTAIAGLISSCVVRLTVCNKVVMGAKK